AVRDANSPGAVPDGDDLLLLAGHGKWRNKNDASQPRRTRRVLPADGPADRQRDATRQPQRPQTPENHPRSTHRLLTQDACAAPVELGRMPPTGLPLLHEEEVDGVVASVFVDIRARMPFVPALFKALAADPKALVAAWLQARAIYETLHHETGFVTVRTFKS